ncbi:MAG TPA: hypothetical protein VEP28_15380 [Rubrobacter sp.]|nr:hypothetical protein [Rubrobacter sp.]
MKKKTVKKLVLAKETVRALAETDLVAPRGAATEFGTICFCGSGHRPCFASEQYTCPC